jgi:hypothetical protein
MSSPFRFRTFGMFKSFVKRVKVIIRCHCPFKYCRELLAHPIHKFNCRCRQRTHHHSSLNDGSPCIRDNGSCSPMHISRFRFRFRSASFQRFTFAYFISSTSSSSSSSFRFSFHKSSPILFSSICRLFEMQSLLHRPPSRLSTSLISPFRLEWGPIRRVRETQFLSLRHINGGPHVQL